MSKLLIDFRLPGTVRDWEAVDDVVMGGRSASEMVPTANGSAVFRGTVSLADGGGFASVRGRSGELDAGAHDGLLVRVRGDGRIYRLRLRTDDAHEGVGYQASFPTRPGQWQEIRLPFAAFAASFRGRAVPEAPPLDPDRIRRLGFLIADRQEGPFRLEVAWIAAYRTRPEEEDEASG